MSKPKCPFLIFDGDVPKCKVKHQTGGIEHGYLPLPASDISKCTELFEKCPIYRGANKKTCINCVPSNSIVAGHFESIINIHSGDLVLSGTEHVTVLETFRRRYVGPAFIIKANGLLPISLTLEHPLLVCEGLTKNCVTVGFSNPKWKLPSQVREKHSDVEGDYLVMPKPPKEIEDTQIDLSPYTTKRGIETLGIRPQFLLNRNSAWLLGIYVAEGCPVEGLQVIFTVGSHETLLIQRIMMSIQRMGYSPIPQRRGSSFAIILPSRILSRAFPIWCGRGARNKRVPEFIMYHRNDEIVNAFLEGYYDGDGHDGDAGHSLMRYAVTSSKTLALQIQLLSTRFNIDVHVYERGSSPSMINGRKIVGKNKFVLASTLKKTSHCQTKFHKGYALIPVREVRRIDYDGEVCNIRTTSGMYSLFNIIVHNCGTTFLKDEGGLIYIDGKPIVTCPGCGSSGVDRQIPEVASPDVTVEEEEVGEEDE